MDFSVINVEFVTKLLLLLLIGMGPKAALIPFLQKTKGLDANTRHAVGRQMVMTAVICAVVAFGFGALLMHLLHMSGGVVAVAGGIILASLALSMLISPRKKIVEEAAALEGPNKIAVSLAVPYLLNSVGITTLIVASADVDSIASGGLVLGLILLVGAFDYIFFANIDKVGKRLNPASLVVADVVIPILLTAIAIHLIVGGLGALSIIATAGTTQHANFAREANGRTLVTSR